MVQPGVWKVFDADANPDSGHLRSPESLNRYSYAAEDPINSNDPDGLCDVAIAGITSSSVNSEAFAFFSADAISVYPYSNGAGGGWFTQSLGVLQGVFDVATQRFGVNSSTTAAIFGLLLAAQDGKVST